MAPFDSIASLEDPGPAQLSGLVGALVGETRRLREQNTALRAENQALRDEVARLKRLPPRPRPRPPSRPSGMEKATGKAAGAGGSGAGGKRSRRRRGAKRDRDAVTAEVVVKAAAVPTGSRFKGYEDVLVRELHLSAAVVRYCRERWLTPTGETVVAPLPAGVWGNAPNRRLRAGAATLPPGGARPGPSDDGAAGQVTTERLTALLHGTGVEISKRQVVRLLTSRLDDLIAEDLGVSRAGLATARWVTVDDTAARHARRDGVTTQIGDDRFTTFRTGSSKSREAFLLALRAGHGEYVINEAALAYMRGRALAGPVPVIELLAAHPVKTFADAAAWRAHLAALGIDRLAVTPDPVRIATEGALWGTVKVHDLLPGTVIVSDDAGQFRVGQHALCWVHAERLVHKLVPATPEQRRAVELVRELIWWFYGDLKLYRCDPCPRRAAALRARFDRIFRRRTGYVMLDRLLARLRRRKAELLRVLERPVDPRCGSTPLHTNGSENDLRACVTKRKISGGTMSEAGRTARDVLLGLMKTCRKLGMSFFQYLGDRLGVPGGPKIPSLPDLVRQQAAA